MTNEVSPLGKVSTLAMGGGRGALAAEWLGTVGYAAALELQRRLAGERAQGEAPDRLLLLEHPHLFTLGRRGPRGHVLSDEATIRAIGAQTVETDRGGEVTYHGPGQLVGYPIVSLRALGLGPVQYVRALEECLIRAAADVGLAAHRVPGKTGVWIGGRPGERVADGKPPAGQKIAAIGVRIARGITTHGFAFNVTTDLSYFQHIVPCGMPGLRVTSLSAANGRAPMVQEVGAIVARHLANVLNLSLEWPA